MQKGSAQIIYPLLGLIVLLSALYFYTSHHPQTLINPISSLTKKDNIYKNSNLGFQFTYSNSLTTKEDTEENFNKRGNGDFRKNFRGYVQYEPGKFLGAAVVLGKDNSYDINPFTVWVFDNPDNLSIDSWYKNYWYYPFVWGDFTYTGKFELAPKTEATISGQMAKSGVIDYQPGKPKFIYLSKDKKMYLFRIIGSDGDKILQSFKFTQ